MKYWHRLTHKFSRKQLEGQLALTRAYQAVFRGSPDRVQQEMVLADLAAHSGFYQVSPHDVSSSSLAYREGRRSLFGVITGHLSLSPDDVLAIENAARHEAIDNSNNNQEF
jgi:hypothetical protein